MPDTPLDQALAVLGQSSAEPLHCVYCDADAQAADRLHGLVKDSEYAGHGHVIGNLVLCCRTCNERKGRRSWREWTDVKCTPDDQVARVAAYESLAPPALDDEHLRQPYPDLMEAYDRLRMHTRDRLRMHTRDRLRMHIRDLRALTPKCWTRSILGCCRGKRDDPTRWPGRIIQMSSSGTRLRCTGTPRARRSP